MFCMNCGTEVQEQGRSCPHCRHPTDVFVSKKGGGGTAVTIIVALGALLFVGVMIIGILAAISIPKFAHLIRRSNEGATKGNLGAMRSALSIYYGDMEGAYPQDPLALTAGGKYLVAVPKAKTPNYHADSDKIAVVQSLRGATDEGGWAYVNNPNSADHGTLFVNCTHTDSKGTAWTDY